jgi:hypothetical protein
MRAIVIPALIAAAACMAGCATLSYDGMPAKNEPYAMAVEEDGVNFVSVDGRPVTRPAFSMAKLRLTPGQHQILTRYDEKESDTDYIGGVEIDVTIHYWSRFAQVVAFDAHEGNRYYLGAQANLPSTEVTYEMWHRELPPDYASTKEGQVQISIDHELTKPDDWRPVITRVLPISKYWRGRPMPVAEIKGEKAPPTGK